jgi:hypothetical protein
MGRQRRFKRKPRTSASDPIPHVSAVSRHSAANLLTREEAYRNHHSSKNAYPHSGCPRRGGFAH